MAVAVVAAGGSARFVGQVGDDHHGTQLIDELQLAGVEAVVTAHGTTGTVVVLVDETGERSFLSDRGAAVHLGSVSESVLDGVDVLHVPAYSLVTGSLADTAQALIGEAVERGIAVSISTSSVAALADYGRSEFLGLLGTIRPQVVIANHDEARFLLGAHPWFRESDATVVSSGAQPARFTKPDGTDIRVAPTPLKPLDTTGAGDAFTGGFLVSYFSNRHADPALRLGHDMAARTLMNAGASIDGVATDNSPIDRATTSETSP